MVSRESGSQTLCYKSDKHCKYKKCGNLVKMSLFNINKASSLDN
jgi:hypothetical protein